MARTSAAHKRRTCHDPLQTPGSLQHPDEAVFANFDVPFIDERGEASRQRRELNIVSQAGEKRLYHAQFEAMFIIVFNYLQQF